jgi:hypothetical protein
MDGRSYQRAQTPLAVEMNGVKAPGEMPSPDSSVTLFGDDANIWKGPGVYQYVLTGFCLGLCLV